MNRKIFTLLLGAIMLVCSALTVNAQLPYIPNKVAAGDGSVLFRDKLTASTVQRLPEKGLMPNYYYLLTLTDIKNPNLANPAIVNLLAEIAAGKTFVLHVDSVVSATTQISNLRIEEFSKLDWDYSYLFRNSNADLGNPYSNKFGALRRALWCVDYNQGLVPGSNVAFNFKQVHTGFPLLAPFRGATGYTLSNDLIDGYPIFNEPINNKSSNLVVNGWHFSQTYLPTQNLQVNRPLFSYIAKDTVAVFVFKDNVVYDPINAAKISGGYLVAVKNAPINNLVEGPASDVYVGGGPNPRGVVSNVLVFTLQKVNPFVLNANDWNAVAARGIGFNPNATLEVTNQRDNNKYINPFTRDFSPLRAYEVNDSLYHYGYMQFKRTTGIPTSNNPGDYLYVDTAWVNYGNNQYLALAWGPRRDNTALTTGLKWGASFASSLGATYNGKMPKITDYLLNGVYWRLDSLIWATLKRAVDPANTPIPLATIVAGTAPAGTIYTGAALEVHIPFNQAQADNWNEVIGEAAALGINVSSFTVGTTVQAVPNTYILYTNASTGGIPDGELGAWAWNTHYTPRVGFSLTTDLSHTAYAAAITRFNAFATDFYTFGMVYMKDSIMENQSKFRVVYDPTADSTFINVYQTRVRYPDYSAGSQNATWPAWWTNSFGIRTWDNGILSGYTGLVRPSDLFTENVFGGSTRTRSIEEASWEYYYGGFGTGNGVLLQKSPDFFSNSTATLSGWIVEGHGVGTTTGGRSTNTGTPPSIANFHSFMEFYPNSTIPGIDRVVISTADTTRLFQSFRGPQSLTFGSNFSALSHIYGWATTSDGLNKYRDSLLYIDLQNLNANNQAILTLDQTFKNGAKGLDTQIKIAFGEKCKAPEEPNTGQATIPNDLYLIQNTKGEFLCVPLWSITDSVYWVTPEANEDPSKMPCYQWAVINIDATRAGSPFTLQNREFRNVRYEYVNAYTTAGRFSIGDSRNPNPAFNKEKLVRGRYTTTTLKWGEFNATEFVASVQAKFPPTEWGFIRLDSDVKKNQLLGYKYIDKDSTYIDIYAFKFLHFLAKTNPRYLSWNGYKPNSTDTTLYAEGVDYYDKLYFSLQEMAKEEIYQNMIELTEATTTGSGAYTQYRDLFTLYKNKKHRYLDYQTMILERFGYWNNATEITDLKPLARQAYRLFLLDPYKWHPTLKGHYVTVGEQDRYILSDKAYATRPYVKGSKSPIGLFGIPHFYFRETLFDIDRVKGNDYFAIVQRIDTARITDPNYFEWGGTKYGDIEDYLNNKMGTLAATKILAQIKSNRELALALMDINHNTGEARFVIRGDAAVGSNTSVFQLERDADPIYRRFHVNEPNEKFGGDKWNTDKPDILEFHQLNGAEKGYKFFENAGNYLDKNDKTRFGKDGGRTYNLKDQGDVTSFYRDTLNNVISFLGLSSVATYPNTNRAFYIDTAFINRGTGWIKPQYLICVDPFNPDESDLGDCDIPVASPNRPYILARYLYNASQYAKAPKASLINPSGTFSVDQNYTFAGASSSNARAFSSNNFNKVEPIQETVLRNPNGASYVVNEKWDRLAFAWAIHKGDSLWVLKGAEPGYPGTAQYSHAKFVYEQLMKEYGDANGKYLDFNKLRTSNLAATAKAYSEAYFPFGDLANAAGSAQVRDYWNYKNNTAGKIGLQAIVELGDNTHKDWVFSFRYVERGASDFVIESETTDRDVRHGAMIRPGYGGWVKTQNGVPSITRSDLKDNMGQASGSVMNVKQLTNPVGNEEVNAAANTVQVIGDVAAVTIQNAAGKKVVITNVLGQTVANAILTSDKATLAAPAGVVVVTVEGQAAVKVLVK